MNIPGIGLAVFLSLIMGVLLGQIDEPFACPDGVWKFIDMLKMATLLGIPAILGFFAGRESRE
jgi:hypothetical protein